MCHHYHGLKYNGQNLDIICPGYRFADERYVVVIPWYLIPGRPYPIQVYQFACSHYSTNPDIGQRGAAEATRIKFKLKTFSHSTVSRSFKSFEQARKRALENRYGEEIEISSTGELIVVAPAPKGTIADDDEPCTDTSEKPCAGRRFPSIGDTAKRRESMSAFLPEYQNDAKIADIEAAVRQFILDWHKKYRCLLL